MGAITEINFPQHFLGIELGTPGWRDRKTMQSWPGEENYAVSTMNQCAKLYSCVFNQKEVDVRSGSKKKSPKTVKIKSRNASFANPSWIPRACGYWRSRRIGSIFEGDVDSTAPSCARNLLPSLGRFLMLQRRNRWKKWLKWLFCAASQRLSKAYSGGFVGEVSAAETSYFVSSCCLQRSSDTSLHLSSLFKQCKWCLSWPCPARASKHLRLIVVYLPGSWRWEVVFALSWT